MFEQPEEDKHIDLSRIEQRHTHEYVDFYSGWGWIDKEKTKQLVWVFCKKCMDKKKLYLDMSELYDEDEEI